MEFCANEASESYFRIDQNQNFTEVTGVLNFWDWTPLDDRTFIIYPVADTFSYDYKWKLVEINSTKILKLDNTDRRFWICFDESWKLI